MMQNARVAIVDGQPLLRSGLASALGEQSGFEVVGEAGTAEQAIALGDGGALDVVIVDALLRAVSGITLTARLLDLWPACKVLGLSDTDEPLVIACCLRAGASGCALKTQPISQIVDAVRMVLGGERYLPPEVSRDAIEAALHTRPDQPFDWLTPREREVFDLLIHGHTNDEISSRLFIARRTVETHRQRVMKKLSARTIVEMIRIAARHGALDR